MRVSVLVPVYNELATLPEILRRLVATDFPKEVICIDDGSTDGSREFLQQLEQQGWEALPQVQLKNVNELKVVYQPRNAGKGAALRRGIDEASGDIITIQDADLEYDPQDIPRVIAPIRDGVADVVFGSRFIGETRRALYFWHSVVNKGLTFLSNAASGLNLTDMETCYKAFRREVLADITLEETRFGFEPEITIKVGKAGLRVYEVPVRYFGRTYDEGKKIGVRDGFRALYAIAKYGLLRS